MLRAAATSLSAMLHKPKLVALPARRAASELGPPADGRATFGVILFGRQRDRAVDHDRRRAVALRLLDGKLHAIEVEQEEAKGR